MEVHARVGLLALLALVHAGCSVKEKDRPAAMTMGAKDADELHSSPVTITESYGSDPLQNGDLRVPAGSGPFPVVIVIHGGCWTAGFATKRNTAALASAITEHGYATWNIEYRQTGDPGGGWPGTLSDWAQATDHLRALGRTHPLDLGRVVVAGHSAGGHAAAWVAARPAGAPPGNDVQVLAVHDAGHFSIIAPGSGPWKEQVEGPLWAFLERVTR